MTSIIQMVILGTIQKKIKSECFSTSALGGVSSRHERYLDYLNDSEYTPGRILSMVCLTLVISGSMC